MTLVCVNNVHKAFGDLEVLKGIDLNVAQGGSGRHHRPQWFG